MPDDAIALTDLSQHIAEALRELKRLQGSPLDEANGRIELIRYRMEQARDAARSLRPEPRPTPATTIPTGFARPLRDSAWDVRSLAAARYAVLLGEAQRLNVDPTMIDVAFKEGTDEVIGVREVPCSCSECTAKRRFAETRCTEGDCQCNADSFTDELALSPEGREALAAAAIEHHDATEAA